MSLIKHKEGLKMNYRKFGKTDFMVSALGFGAMRLPIIGGDPSNINEDEAVRMIRYAIDNGLNYVDTAYSYHRGNGELLVGKALKDGFRKKTVVATKLPVWLIESQSDMNEKFDEQLRKLQTDYIDFYLLHSLNKSSWEKMVHLDYFSWAERMVKDGKIRYLGFSFHDEFQVFKSIVDYYDKWTFVQIQYNYLDVNLQAGLQGLKYANDKGLAVVVMEPLRGGELSNMPKEVLSIFEQTGAHRSSVDWALKWLWNQPEVSVVLSGMSTYEQVEQNIRFASESQVGTLSKNELNVFDDARKLIQALNPIACTGCEYCLPCTVGLNIPQIFDIYNKGYLFAQIDKAKSRYSFMVEIKADVCIKCGECETKCPQKLPIRDLLEKINKEFSNG
jgi:predicted aldo/keto reductase-like oxidoreductase